MEVNEIANSVAEANPLELSLDDIIKLNALRNKELDKETTVSSPQTSQLNGFYHKNPILSDYANNVNMQISQWPDFGSRKIHARLGYNFTMRKKNFPNYPTQNRAMAYKCLTRARQRTWRTDKKTIPVRTFMNENVLKRQSMNKTSLLMFNREKNSGFMRNMMGSARKRPGFPRNSPIRRHSIKNSLTSDIQDQIKVFCDYGEMAEIDLVVLDDFKANPETTKISIHERLSAYD